MSFAVEPVTLPPEAWYPGLKAFVRREESAKCERAIAAAEAGVQDREGRASRAARVGRGRGSRPRRSTSRRSGPGSPPTDVIYAAGQGRREGRDRAAARAEASTGIDAASVDVAQAERAVAAARKQEPAAAAQGRPSWPGRAQAAAKAVAAAAPAKPPSTDDTRRSRPSIPKTSTGRRAALARWITSRDNPLTARVAVNHLWRWHFGRPLVATTHNFGRNGKPPTHPELLDWLAVELMDRTAGA